MAAIYLIRHGQANTKSAEYDMLSELGKEQAALIAQSLASKCATPDSLTIGGMKRHQQTADLALSCCQLDATKTSIDVGWNEYDHQAILAGLDERLRTPEGIRQYFIENNLQKHQFRSVFIEAMVKWINSGDSQAYPESWYDFHARVDSAFDSVLKRVEQNHFVFTSGGPISLVVSRLLGLDKEQFMTINWNLVNTGITKILLNKQTGHLSLSCLNEHTTFDYEEHKNKLSYT